jgi:hypothetical protein
LAGLVFGNHKVNKVKQKEKNLVKRISITNVQHQFLFQNYPKLFYFLNLFFHPDYLIFGFISAKEGSSCDEESEFRGLL